MYPVLNGQEFLKLAQNHEFVTVVKVEGIPHVLMGVEALFELGSDDWKALDVFLDKHQNDLLFTAISYHLGSLVYPQIKAPENLKHPYLRLVKPKEVYVLELGEMGKVKFPSVKWKDELKDKYQKDFNDLRQAIQLGEVYEANLCWPFIGETDIKDPLALFLSEESEKPRPFSVFYKWKDDFVLCYSPERFLKKEGNWMVSEPIKGTRPRGGDLATDEGLKNELLNDLKERAENTMIVDLVRNDMSKVAQKNSVQVPELCHVYSYPHVHQMISKVSCNLRPEVPFSEILKALFPMGSMTGAPKLAAMQQIEKLEHFDRGLYSGSLGYIHGDAFDLNVVIRSWMYDQKNKEIKGAFGSAVTILAKGADEWEEVLTKFNSVYASI